MHTHFHFLNRLDQRHLVAGVMLLMALLSSQCRSTPNQYPKLPHYYSREGLVTSSTYQTHVSVMAQSQKEAIESSKNIARKKVFNMMLNEPSLHYWISSYGKERLKNLIQKNGSVVYAIPESQSSWVVVFQVYKRGLWDQLRTIQ